MTSSVQRLWSVLAERGLHRKRDKQLITTALFFLFFIAGVSAPALDQKTKLEQLFLWKISEELKLSIKEEKHLNEIVQDLNSRRQTVADGIQKIISNMSKSKEAKPLEKSMLEYKKFLKLQADLNIEEIDRVKKALGLEKASQYLVVKSELSVKVKGLLLSPEKTSEKP